MEIVYDKLPEEQAKELTEAAEDGKGGAISKALGSMCFDDLYDSFKQIEQQNKKNVDNDSSLPKLSVELDLDNKQKSQTVTLRRSCDAWGPKGEVVYSRTHNFNGIGNAQWSSVSILCPPRR